MFNSSLKYRFRFFIEREHRSFQLYLYSFVIFFNLIFFFCFFIVITMTNENKFRPSLVPIFSRISKNPKGNIKLILILKLFQKLYHDSERIHEESSNTGDLPRIMQQSSLNQAAGRTRHVHNNELATSRSTGYTRK